MSKETKQAFERRLYPRVELMRLSIGDRSQSAALIIDISASGAQVEFPTRLQTGHLYEVRLSFPDRQIRVRARVTRSIEGSGGGCVAGLEFIGLEADDQRYLEGYVAGQTDLLK